MIFQGVFAYRSSDAWAEPHQTTNRGAIAFPSQYCLSG